MWSPDLCLWRYQVYLKPRLETGKWVKDEDEFLREVVTNLQDAGGYVDRVMNEDVNFPSFYF